MSWAAGGAYLRRIGYAPLAAGRKLQAGFEMPKLRQLLGEQRERIAEGHAIAAPAHRGLHATGAAAAAQIIGVSPI
jgi:hypothetical protein